MPFPTVYCFMLIRCSGSVFTSRCLAMALFWHSYYNIFSTNFLTYLFIYHRCPYTSVQKIDVCAWVQTSGKFTTSECIVMALRHTQCTIALMEPVYTTPLCTVTLLVYKKRSVLTSDKLKCRSHILRQRLSTETTFIVMEEES
jgi:hypothetical protein